MNTHPTELLPAFVLGALDEHDTRLVAAHLKICPQCHDEADHFRASIGMLPNGVPPSPPPAHVKRQLLARIQASRPVSHAPHTVAPAAWSGWTRGLALASLLLALLFGAMMVDARRQLSSAQDAIASLEAGGQPEQEQQIAAFLSHPATVSQALAGRPGVTANMYMQAGHNRAVLLVSGLPVLEAGKTYQFWFANGAAQVPAGTFAVDAHGVAQAVFDAPAPVNTYGEVMVTIEPSGGSRLPSSEVVLAAKLAA